MLSHFSRHSRNSDANFSLMGTSLIFFLPLTIRFGNTTQVDVTFSNFKLRPSLIRAAVERVKLKTALSAGLQASMTASACSDERTSACPWPWLLGMPFSLLDQLLESTVSWTRPGTTRNCNFVDLGCLRLWGVVIYIKDNFDSRAAFLRKRNFGGGRSHLPSPLYTPPSHIR